MKKLLVIAVFVTLLAPQLLKADACPTATYAQYLGQGFSCGIGDKNFSLFQYSSSSTPTGFGDPAGSVSVTPILAAGNPGFQYEATWLASTASGISSNSSDIQYQVNVNQGGQAITGASLSIGGFGFDGTGNVLVDETLCLGAVLPSCTGGTIDQLSVFAGSGGSKSYDSISFAGVTEVSVENDILVTSGSDGGGTLSLVTNQFNEGSSVPEPGSFVLFGSGILAVVGALRRKLSA